MKKELAIKKYYNQKNKLTTKNSNYLRQLNNIVDFILLEDLNSIGDITTDKLITKNSPAQAVMIAKQDGILAGLEETLYITKKYKIKAKIYKKDGAILKSKDKILSLSGGIKDLLKLERLIVNIIQRMSGIATETHKLTKITKNKALVVSTRKTLWGLLDKKAVTVGGGGTHRLGLYNFILIKNNHLDFANNINFKNLKSFWELEIRDEEELKMAIKNNAPAIMFDNFSSEEIKRLIKKYHSQLKNTVLEASGMITEKNIKQYAESGVNIISIGKLTHSSRALDISLRIIK